MIVMLAPLHGDFGLFRFVLEDIPEPNQYRLKLFPRFSSLYTPLVPRNRVVSLVSQDNPYPLPEARYLHLHAAIGNILHASGRAEGIQKLIQDLGETGGSVLRNGSTNISDLLSVSDLSLLASDPHPTHRKVQQ